MSGLRTTLERLRPHLLSLGVMAALGVGGALGVRWILVNQRSGPPPRKAVEFQVVTLQPARPKPPPPPPPPQEKPRELDEPPPERVELEAMRLPPDAPPPPPGPAPGPLALAAEGDGPGDAFNLAGNPGGRGLLSGGGLGDGAGGGVGGEYDPMARYGYFYGKVATALEDCYRKDKLLSAASLRVELRVRQDLSGTITGIELVRSTGDARHDRAIESRCIGARLVAPAADVPMPMVLRLNIRRPQ